MGREKGGRRENRKRNGKGKGEGKYVRSPLFVITQNGHANILIKNIW